MLVQSILAPDQGYERYRGTVGFTQRYIFPGGILPCLTAMAGAMSRATDLRIVHLEDISPHYAPTLRTWRERLLAGADRARALGYDDGFLRTWEFYFATCEAGFLEGAIGNAQVLFAKPGCTDALYEGSAARPLPEALGAQARA
jgi:cyclopropane-fatty-acyl-phospholipid synthase